MITRASNASIAAGVFTLAAVLASAASAQTAPAAAAAQPAASDASAPAAPSTPAPPPVALSTHAIEDASAFRAYAKKAEAISPAFTDGAGVEDSLAIGSAYEPQQLARGEVAYAALLALQDPSFVAGVRTYAVDPAQRHDLAQRLVQDPRYAIAFPDAAHAAGMIVATLGAETARIQATGAQVKQSAYSVQHFKWSKSRVTNPDVRLARAKALSAALMSSVPDDVQQLELAVNGGSDAKAAQVLGVHGQPVDGPYGSVVTRGLALAALAALGEAGDDSDAQVQTLLADDTDRTCLNMSKLNLYQCLAVAGPWYEDIFCLGEHALGETGQCLTKETATPAQLQAAVTPVSSAGAGAMVQPTPVAAATSQAMIQQTSVAVAR